MPASLHWIPLDVDFPTSRKAIALGVAVGNPVAWAHVVRLWAWCARNAQDGAVEGPDAVAVLEHAAGWPGTPGALVEACSLPHIRLLDVTPKGFAIHDWADHCGAHVEKKRKDAARVAEYRRTVRERFANGTRTKNGRTGEEEEGEVEEDVQSNDRSRSPTVIPSEGRGRGKGVRKNLAPVKLAPDDCLTRWDEATQSNVPVGLTTSAMERIAGKRTP